VPPHFGCQVTAYLDHHYENCWIGHHGPIPILPRSLAITTKIREYGYCQKKHVEMSTNTYTVVSNTGSVHAVDMEKMKNEYKIVVIKHEEGHMGDLPICC
jgi:hypothetical protein